MKKFLVFVFVLGLALTTGLLFARWARVFGGPYHDFVHSAWELPDRDIVVGGETQVLSGTPVHLWLSRLSPSGAVRWQKQYYLTNNDIMNGFEPTPDGGFAVLSGGLWFLKLNADGLIEWQRLYSSSPNGTGAKALKVTSDGGYILGGMQYYSSLGGQEVVLVKITGDGAIQWQKRYGGADYDELMGIEQTSDGGYVLAVRTNNFSAGEMDFMVVRINSSGVLQWAKTYGGPDYDEIRAVRPASDGGFYVFGRTESFGLGTVDAWLLKLTSTGTIQWQKTYGGTAIEQGADIYVTASGDLLLTGITTSFGTGMGDVWALKLDAAGGVLWQRTYGSGSAADFGGSIRPTLDGGAVIGASAQSVGFGQMDCLVLRLFPDGNLDAGCPSSGYQIGTSTATVQSTAVSAVTASLSSATTSLVMTIPAGVQTSQALNTRSICESIKKGRLR